MGKEVIQDGQRLKSSFPGIWKETESRSTLTKPVNPYEWLAAKRRADDIGPLWRVHDKLYDLTDFIHDHPGGSDWIDITRGQDITEAFEASHIVNWTSVEKTLSKYYVRDASHPRNSPYTFQSDGFYLTLKRSVAPILKQVGSNSTRSIILMQDTLAGLYVLIALLSVYFNYLPLQIVAGIFLGMTTIAAHNFFHMKDSLRRFYFDLSLFSSLEWRVTHGLSHHLYPNTILDYEVEVFEPWLESLPIRSKNMFQRYLPIVYEQGVFVFGGWLSLLTRIQCMVKGQAALRKENLLILVELMTCVLIAPGVTEGLISWIVILTVGAYHMFLVGMHASHHHPKAFHDGDEARADPDFGLCQLDATLEKSDTIHQSLFAQLTTFGNHPLHHLFPTVCHSKLHFIKPEVDLVLKQFNVTIESASQFDLFIGTHKTYANVTRRRFHEVSRDIVKSDDAHDVDKVSNNVNKRGSQSSSLSSPSNGQQSVTTARAQS